MALPKAKSLREARKKNKIRPLKARKQANKPAGIWQWKTPDERSKLRFALGLLLSLLSLITLASGEIRASQGTWRAGFHNLKGQFVMGFEWAQGKWPCRWRGPE